MTLEDFELTDEPTPAQAIPAAPPSLGNRPLRDYQADALQQLRAAMKAGYRRPLLQAPTGYGKCLGKGTPVLKYDGTITVVEDIRAGDVLIGPDSQPRKVLSTCIGMENLYRIVPTKGDSYVVNESHILSLVFTGGTVGRSGKRKPLIAPGRRGGRRDGDVVNISVSDYLQSSRTFRHCAKGWRSPANFSGSVALPVDPYFLGIWLGDGSSRDPEITTGDLEVANAFRSYAEELGLIVAEAQNSPNSRIYRARKELRSNKPNEIAKRLSDIGVLNNKHIPHLFKIASKEERLSLLAGIIDTDGYLQPRQSYDVTLKSERLMDDVIFVARSLGFGAYKKKVMKTCVNNGVSGYYWQACISGNLDEIPCRIARKKASPRAQKKNPLRVGIKAVEPLGVGEYFGFELDSDGLFLLGDFTVTHNTRLAAEIILRALERKNRVVFCVPALSLIEQTVQAFWREGIRDIGVIQADHADTDWSRPVQVASVQTLARRDYPRADLVIIDEAHRWFEHYAKWMCDDLNKPFIGLSATPWTKGLGKYYDHLIISATTQELIERGYLSKFRVFAPSHPDLSGVKIVGGDYHEGQLSERMNKPKLIGDVVESWIKLGENRPTLCFGVDCAHAKALQQRFESAGIPCGYQDAYTKDEERREIKRKFEKREYLVVCNVGTLTTGVDWDVRCIILARPTKSEMLFVQIIGRGLRTASGKEDCVIIDHSDTHLRLGFVTDIHHETLDDGKPTDKAEKKEPLPKECPQCHALRPARMSLCPHCGFQAEAKDAVAVQAGELQELRGRGGAEKHPPGFVKIRGILIKRGEFYAELKGYACEKGYAPGWVSNKYREMVGTWPNHYSDVRPLPCSPEVRSWIISRQIAWAKRKDRAAS